MNVTPTGLVKMQAQCHKLASLKMAMCNKILLKKYSEAIIKQMWAKVNNNI